jgi:hypothetical protein
MFIIRMEDSRLDKPGALFMKTTLGPLMFGFTTENLANAYVKAGGPAAKLVAVSRDALSARDPAAFDGVTHLLLFPSLEVLKACYRDKEAFPFQDYVFELSPAAS